METANTNDLRALQLEEALLRLKMLGVLGDVTKSLRYGKLYKSEHAGILYWLDEKEIELVKNFEKKHGAFVYHVIKNNLEFGTCNTLLYVSKNRKEWAQEKRDLKDGYAMAYVDNETEPMFSEFVSVGVRPCVGGIRRTY